MKPKMIYRGGMWMLVKDGMVIEGNDPLLVQAFAFDRENLVNRYTSRLLVRGRMCVYTYPLTPGKRDEPSKPRDEAETGRLEAFIAMCKRAYGGWREEVEA